MSDAPLTARAAPSISDIASADWDGLAGADNPFVSHAFLALLEESGSVGQGTGWQPIPIVIEDEAGQLLAAMPSYLKDHSQGEYVFDHAWADAWERAGGAYYPKLQIAVPFTPVSGPRLLLSDAALGGALLQTAEQLCLQNGLSSAHASFVEREQLPIFERALWLLRSDIQFHWHNRGYATFDDFLKALSSRKRKAVRKERARASEGLDIVQLSGDEIMPRDWDDFWLFYQDTGARKWGYPYLTRKAFTLMAERMGDKIVMVLAREEGRNIAGALNFMGREAIYGRYWGCREQRPFLHFELCYYQAIELAIARGLGRVEAGAQGGHKIARGYEPERTFSAHYIADEGFRAAIAHFLEREQQGIAQDQLWLGQRTPFKKG